jgi:hypothetical protein
MSILPDVEGEIREVQLVNLQGRVDSQLVTIDGLRAVLQTLWPQVPQAYELLPDAHCKIVDHYDQRQTYYVNEAMAAELWRIHGFLDEVNFDALSDNIYYGAPMPLLSHLGRLAVALESRADRALRIKLMEQNRERRLAPGVVQGGG